MKRTKKMWAVLHVPSDSWDNGDAELTLYPFKHEALLQCSTESFAPIEVVVSLAQKKAKKETPTRHDRPHRSGSSRWRFSDDDV